MITKVKDDIRIKQAMPMYKNRHIANKKISMYQQKKMLKISKQLREEIDRTDNFSADDYFTRLNAISRAQHRDIYCKLLSKRSQKKLSNMRKGNDNVRYGVEE